MWLGMSSASSWLHRHLLIRKGGVQKMLVNSPVSDFMKITDWFVNCYRWMGIAKLTVLLLLHTANKRSYHKEPLLLDWGYSLCCIRSLCHCKFVGPTFGPISLLGVTRILKDGTSSYKTVFNCKNK